MLNPSPSNSNSPSDPAGCQERGTLRELFEAEESRLLRYAFALLGRRAVAEELVQEVFLHLHARWSEVEAPRAWLYRSVRNRAWNYLKKSRRETLGSDWAEGVEKLMMESINSPDVPPDQRLAQREMVAALRGLVDELSENDRQLIRLKYFDDLKYREISERTGLTISNVGYRLHHIMHQLARKLRPLGVDEE